jgi:putative tryptophan/tyrosine transport system substrate-binding protein
MGKPTHKRLQMLKEVVPTLSRVAIVSNPRNPVNTRLLTESEVAARSLGVQLQLLEARVPADLDRAFQAATKAIIAPGSPSSP